MTEGQRRQDYGEQIRAFRAEQKIHHQKIEEKLAEQSETLSKLSPLAELVPQLREIAKNQEAIQRTSKIALKALAGISLVVGVIYSIYQLFAAIIHDMLTRR